ncbi:protein NYNRIN-like [Emys orbicularis]|uniref:protein NYNRIN-like n=1 Tax=Emys orbicularis TaxID=82168 RepID=UPI0031FC639E
MAVVIIKTARYTPDMLLYNQSQEKYCKARQAALLDESHLWRHTPPPISKIQPLDPDVNSQLDIKQLQQQDQQIKSLLGKGECKGYSIYTDKHGLILACRKNDNNAFPVVVMPSGLRKELVILAHQQGHFCPEKIMARLTSVAWLPEIWKDVNTHIQSCLRCVENNATSRIAKGPLQHHLIEGPWCKIQIDYIGPLPCTGRGHKYCLVVVDVFTKWVEAYPTKNCTAKTTAKVLLEETFSRFGLPLEMDSDQGPHFVGEITQVLCQALGVKQRLHIAGHPQSSGSVERTNRTLKTALREVISFQGKDWDIKLPLVLMAIRSTIASHGFTPFEAMMGRPMRAPEHWWVGGQPPDEYQPRLKIDAYMTRILHDIINIQRQLAAQLKANIKVMDRKLGHVKAIEWDIGDKVLYKYYSDKGHALSPRWIGPAVIVNKASPNVYQVEIPDKKRKYIKWFHSSQLKPWKGAEPGVLKQ